MKHILASLGMWLTRRFGSARPGEVIYPKGSTIHLEILDVTPPMQYRTRVCIVGRPDLYSGPFSSVQSAELSRAMAYEQLKDLGMSFGVTIEPLLVGRDTPHEAAPPTEAKE